ncbi:MAG: hypothetical protein H0X28_11400, partial [Solirubrobacterales bacterium]|nr:hypothetical protein [Solirubrobacterales bacterium]
ARMVRRDGDGGPGSFRAMGDRQQPQRGDRDPALGARGSVTPLALQQTLF